MSSGSRARSERVASLNLPPGRMARLAKLLRRSDILLRISLFLLAALVVWIATGGWQPPFAFRRGQVPSRDLVSRIAFSHPDAAKTKALQEIRLRETVCVYRHEPKPLQELRQSLQSEFVQVIRAASFEQIDGAVWKKFLDDKSRPKSQQLFDQIRKTFAGTESLKQLDRAVREAFQPLEKTGLLEKLQHELDEGSHTEILVSQSAQQTQTIPVSEVQIAEVLPTLRKSLRTSLQKAAISDDDVEAVVTLLHAWIAKQGLPTTLVLDDVATNQQYEEALASVQEATYEHRRGDTLVKAGEPLGEDQIQLLQREHREVLAHLSIGQAVAYGSAKLGMFVAVYLLGACWIYIRRPKLLADNRKYVSLLILTVLTIGLAWFAARDGWWAELIPVLLFAMTAAVAYNRELALILSALTSLVVTLTLGQGLSEFAVLAASSSSAVMLMNSVRTRTKLILVGSVAGISAFLATLGIGLLIGQAVADAKSAELPHPIWMLLTTLSQSALLQAFYALLAGFVMTGLLPFIEKLFAVQTDLSLLELGNGTHRLLQELSRRAPGTYNHSINVASLGEAAADAIGARGLLVRVGAYFHDIGKMLEPQYFVENQSPGDNRHESLVPAMSTLVIIAHVKDGADLARKHHLPQAVIDFIEQHHGTTLVEFFYRRAKEAEEAQENGEVDETTFRYPGPKPRSREAGVMMLADAVESASRSLVEPAPARIESLVKDIAMSRLLDGQFDKCGMTLEELHTVEQTLVKSLIAVYHGRVKYPDKQQPRIASQTVG